MTKMNDLLAVAGIILSNSDFDENISIEDMKYEMDPDVSSCRTYLYFYMMLDDDSKLQDEMFEEFSTRYHSLNESQQDYVKRDFISIINTQNKNKELVREKGNDKYE